MAQQEPEETLNSEAEAESLKSFYLEILAKPGYKKSFAKLKALEED